MNLPQRHERGCCVKGKGVPRKELTTRTMSVLTVVPDIMGWQRGSRLVDRVEGNEAVLCLSHPEDCFQEEEAFACKTKQRDDVV